MASPIPAIAYQGLVRPYGSQLLELSPPHTHQNCKKMDADSGTFFEKSVLGRKLVHNLGAQGSKKAPDAKKYNKC